MSNGTEKLFHILTDAGVVATHPARAARVIRVAPTTGNDVNVLAEELLPVACVRLDDARFEFGSSFVGEGAKNELKNLEELRREIPGMPVSIFGHADPAGDDDFNKQLSGRRAQAMYGLLTRKTKLWDDLFLHPLGDDNWKWKAIQHMLTTLQFYDGPIHGQLDGPTRKAISDFGDKSRSPALKPDPEPFNETRPLIYLAYMNRICVDGKGNKFQLDPVEDFLAREADDKLGRGDYQGCSEFNPSKVFSIAQDAEFKKSADKTKRNEENLPNRRVIIYLFPPGRSVDLFKWPCPAAKQGSAACKDQFFKADPKGDKRRNPQTLPREYKDTQDTFACKFYDRLALESPCERRDLRLQTQLVRVHLRLLYLDPEGKPHVFPPKFPVILSFPGAGGRDPAIHEVEADGKVTFTADRRRLPLQLTFETPGTQYIASATAQTKGPGPERFATLKELKDLRADHYRVFSLPQRTWDLDTSEWKDSKGTRLTVIASPDPTSQSIGSDAAPAELTLDPHWQFLRFTYFDRRRKAKLAVPVDELLVEGFRDISAMQVTLPDTSSNWTVSSPNECQCVPWILRAPPKPDEKVLLQFETESNTFIQSSATGPRTIVRGDPRRQPNAARLDFYDLPQFWKSRTYFARLSAKEANRFEKLAAKPTTSAQPLTFCLDDIVLTDNALAPVAWTPKTDRAAIFSHTFESGQDLSAIGLFKQDPAQPFVSKIPDIENDRNYIAEYPDWTRLVIANSDLYDVFHKRTPDVDGRVVGARAGVRWDPKTNVSRRFPNGDLSPRPDAAPIPPGDFFVVQSFFQQEHARRFGREPGKDPFIVHEIGRFDLAILRCCDAVGGLEKAVSLHYFRFNFDFSPPPDPHFFNSVNNVANQQAFANDTCQNIMNRWNGNDDQSPNQALLVSADPSKNNVETRVLWFVQPVPRPADAHYKLDIYKEVRAHMQSSTGHGAIQENDKQEDPVDDPKTGKSKGAFVAAHETGHGDSLHDEYIERGTNASYLEPGFGDSIPGSPYDLDRQSMMNENKEPRPRHFWHVAEWLKAVYGFAFEVKLGNFQFSLLANPDFPKRHRSFLGWPLLHAINAESGIIPDSVGNKIGTGKYDAYLYPLADEKYRDIVLPHGVGLPGGRFKAILIVVVKMAFTVLNTNTMDPIRNGMIQVVNGVNRRFNETNRFFLTSAARADLSPCLIHFSPRVLVRNFADDERLKKTMNVKDGEEYQKKVQSVLDENGLHFEIELRDSGTSRWFSTVSPSPTGLGFVSRLLLTFQTDLKQGDINLVTEFPKFFANMVGVEGRNEGATDARIDSAASYQPIVTKVIPDAVVQKMP